MKWLKVLLKRQPRLSDTPTTRQRRLSMSCEQDSLMPGSDPGESHVVTQAGVEFKRIKINQDAYFVDEEKMIFAVFDGHGRLGHHCSKFVRQHVESCLASVPSTSSGISEALNKVGDAIVKDSTLDTEFSGTTLLVVLVTQETIISAWLGDSRAILKRGEAVIALSEDHKPDIPAERKRILKAGGNIKQLRDENGNKFGPLRVFKPSSTMPGVNFSRSLGDAMIHKYGVSSVVQVIEEHRTHQDRFIVVATDGIFEFISNDEVVQIVSTCHNVKQAADTLLKEARERWMKFEDSCADDITVVVIKLN